MGSRGTKRRALAWFPGRTGCRLLDDEFWPDEGPPVGTPRVCRPGPGQLILDQTDGQFTITADEFIWPIQIVPVWGEQDWHALRSDGTTYDHLDEEALVLKFRGAWLVNDSPVECWFGWNLDVTPDTVANAEHTFSRTTALGTGIHCTSGGSDATLALRDLWPAGLGDYWQASIVIRAYTPTGLHWYPGAPGVFSYGAHFFYRDEGADLVHHLLAWYRQLQSRTDPLHPGFSNFDSEGKFDYVKIACQLPDLRDPLILPTAYDEFTDNNGVLLPVHAMDYGGFTWVNAVGVWIITGNQADPDNSAWAYCYVPTLTPDDWEEVDMLLPTGANSLQGLVGRGSADTSGGCNYWLLPIQGNNAGVDTRIYDINDGVWTIRASADNDWADNTTYNLRARYDGVQITFYVDYIERLHYATAWFNRHATWFGLYAHGLDAARFDNFITLPRGTGLERVCYDDFTHINGTSLDATVTEEGALAWDEHNGNWDIQTNEANVDSSFAQALVVTEVSNVWVGARVLLVTDTKPQGVLFRKGPDTGGNDNHWIYHIASGIAGIDTWLAEVDNGVQTFRATADGDYVAATRYYLQVYANGQTITGYVDGTQRGTFGAASFNELATWHGLYSHTADTGARWDQFRVTDIPALGEYDATLNAIS